MLLAFSCKNTDISMRSDNLSDSKLYWTPLLFELPDRCLDSPQVWCISPSLSYDCSPTWNLNWLTKIPL